ncbi:MAG: vWA domain-containing protein [Candidatus Margulisiibacteriota bacterium]
MFKKSLYVLIGIVMVAMTMYGCSVTSSFTSSKDPGVLGSSEVTMSGAASYTGGKVEVGLAALFKGTGEALTLDKGRFTVYVGKDGIPTTDWGSVDFALPTDSDKPIDMVFVLDNTGSMSGSITGAKNSIVAFAASLEAAGVDAKFALVTYGDSAIHPTPAGYITSESFSDATYVRPVLDFNNAATLQATLDAVHADGGGDGPENPLDAIMYGYNNFSWRAGAQRVIVVITDINGHQNVAGDTSSNNKCLTSIEAVALNLAGKAVVYAVSPNYSTDQSPYCDVRRLADGLGEGRTTPLSNTGGKWIQFGYYGYDLTTLGITTAVSKGYKFTFDYTFADGTWWIHIVADTDGDGVMDSELLIKIIVSGGTGSSSIKSASVVNSRPLSQAEILRLQTVKQ